ncbi:uncharacterized protein LOC121192962 isoform X2 [Toxotes jaculatrix]|nr:uncharacterized protein LOC121192962 isoform X2 [Toxotes jaculatrix]
MPDTVAEAHAVLRGGCDVSVGVSGALEMIDTFDRPGNAFAVGAYAGADSFANGFEDKPGKRIPKAGLYAAAGVGYARAEWSVFDAEAKGPNASAGVGVSAASLSARAFARAEVASASASAGPVKATVGLAVDTGVGVGATGLEAKVLGTGFTIGPRISFSLLGNGIEIDLF